MNYFKAQVDHILISAMNDKYKLMILKFMALIASKERLPKQVEFSKIFRQKTFEKLTKELNQNGFEIFKIAIKQLLDVQRFYIKNKKDTHSIWDLNGVPGSLLENMRNFLVSETEDNKLPNGIPKSFLYSIRIYSKSNSSRDTISKETTTTKSSNQENKNDVVVVSLGNGGNEENKKNMVYEKTNQEIQTYVAIQEKRGKIKESKAGYTSKVFREFFENPELKIQQIRDFNQEFSGKILERKNIETEVSPEILERQKAETELSFYLSFFKCLPLKEQNKIEQIAMKEIPERVLGMGRENPIFKAELNCLIVEYLKKNKTPELELEPIGRDQKCTQI